MTFRLSARSLTKLQGVHPHLARVVHRAIEMTKVDFAVIEGLRDIKRQQMLVDAGASMTLKSRHLTGHAVDLGAWVGGQIRWDWPLYGVINNAMQDASKEMGIPVEWGGEWKKFKDGPHFQLPWKEYPWTP